MPDDVITDLTDTDIKTTWKQSVPRMEGDDDATDAAEGDDDATDAGEGDDDATDTADDDADATDS